MPEPTYHPLATVFKALGDENRLQILHFIGGGAKSVSEIVDQTGLSQPLVSHHLQQLRLAGLVRTERNGPFVYYSLAEPTILESLEAWNHVLANLSIQAAREAEERRLPRWCEPMRSRMAREERGSDRSHMRRRGRSHE